MCGVLGAFRGGVGVLGLGCSWGGVGGRVGGRVVGGGTTAFFFFFFVFYQPAISFSLTNTCYQNELANIR